MSTSPVFPDRRVGPEGLPELTLGWQVLGWTKKWLRQPDGPEAGRPWTFTDEQARFILWWFAVDGNGRWMYRTGTLRRSKGWGKDPVGAVLCAVEFVGPCRFDRFVDGQPLAKVHPASWVSTVAVSKDQTRNTMRLFPGLFSHEAIDEFSIDLGKEIIYAHKGRAVIEAVTSSPRALEGGRTTFTLCNEKQHWMKNNDGHAMAGVINGNLTKSRDGAARSLSICNAHIPGEDSSGEHDWDAFQAMEQGRSKSTGYLYDSVEAPADTDLGDADSLRHGLLVARGDSYWLNIDRHIEEIWDPRTPPSESRRKYLNQIVAAEDAWLAPHEWDACKSDAVFEDGDRVALGFDGSKSDDHTALVACRIDDGLVSPLGIWDPAMFGGDTPRDLVDAAVTRAFDRFDVVAFFGDLHPFESYIDKWAREFGDLLRVKASGKHPIAWDMRTRTKEFTLAAESFHDEVLEGTLLHDGDPAFSQHVYNARRRPNAWGVSVGKEHRESSRKIDSVPAAVLSRLGRQQFMVNPGKAGKRQSSQLVGV